MFKLATGALVISKTIEERVKERAAEVNPHLVIQRVPAIVDAYRFAAASPAMASRADQSVPSFVYCSTWLKDVLFLIRVFASVRLNDYGCKLTFVGNSGHQSGRIMEYAMERGLSAEDIVLAGCVDERALEACYKNAVALLMPLWNDDQSLTRMPNKLGEYLGLRAGQLSVAELETSRTFWSTM
jgi:hypothetical protein